MAPTLTDLAPLQCNSCARCARVGYLCTAGVLYSAKAVQYSMRLGEIKIGEAAAPAWKLVQMHTSATSFDRDGSPDPSRVSRVYNRPRHCPLTCHGGNLPGTQGHY